MSALSTSPYTPAMASTAADHNSVVNPIINAVNAHSHDPADATNGFGGAINSKTGAIPADTTEAVLYPSSGTGAGTYTAIAASAGVGSEVARIRGQVARLIGGNWYDNTGAAIRYDAGTFNFTTTGVVSAGSLTSTAAQGTAPLTITSTTRVINLNADLHGGYPAVSAASTQTPASFVNSIPALDANGFLPQGLVYYDASEASTNDALVVGSSSIVNNLNRVRYVLGQWNAAAGGTGWNAPPTNIVASLSNGQGTLVSQVSRGVYRVDVTGVATTVQGGLTYSDILADAVISGLNTTAATGLNVNVNAGIAYVAGGRQQLVYAQTVALTASTTNYIYWDGGPNVADFIVNTTGTRPNGTIPIASVVTGASGVTSITDTRIIGTNLNGHLLVTGNAPTVASAVGTNITGVGLVPGSNDVRGSVQFTGTATSVAGQAIVNITFANQYPGTPFISCDMVGNNAIQANPTNKSATGFSIYVASALTSGAAYTVDYIILG